MCALCMSARVLASLIPRLLCSRTEEPGIEGISWQGKGGRKSFCDRASLPIRCRYWENLPVELLASALGANLLPRILILRFAQIERTLWVERS